MNSKGPGKVANRLVALSSAAVLAVYAAGYVRTESAAEQLEARVSKARPAAQPQPDAPRQPQTPPAPPTEIASEKQQVPTRPLPTETPAVPGTPAAPAVEVAVAAPATPAAPAAIVEQKMEPASIPQPAAV